MTEASLVITVPQEPDDCLPPLLPGLPRSDLWVGYLTVDGRHLADLNDDPEAEDLFDRGMEVWPRCVTALLGVLALVHGGTLVRASVTDRDVELAAGLDAEPARDEIDGLSTYGGIATVWTSGRSRELDPASVLAGQGVDWWLVHGYKEPFVVGRSPAAPPASLVAPVTERLALPVRTSTLPFVPHRTRQHGR